MFRKLLDGVDVATSCGPERLRRWSSATTRSLTQWGHRGLPFRDRNRGSLNLEARLSVPRASGFGLTHKPPMGSGPRRGRLACSGRCPSAGPVPADKEP